MAFLSLSLTLRGTPIQLMVYNLINHERSNLCFLFYFFTLCSSLATPYFSSTSFLSGVHSNGVEIVLWIYLLLQNSVFMHAGLKWLCYIPRYYRTHPVYLFSWLYFLRELCVAYLLTTWHYLFKFFLNLSTSSVMIRRLTSVICCQTYYWDELPLISLLRDVYEGFLGYIAKRRIAIVGIAQFFKDYQTVFKNEHTS